jgi:hypothetical protein
VIRSQGGVIGAQMVNATTGAAFAGTVSAFVTGDGGTQAAATNSCVAEGNGYYTVVLTGPETDYELVAVTFTGSSAIPATVQVVTTAIAPVPSPSSAITGSTVTTALTLLTAALEELEVYQPGEPISDTDAQTCLGYLNRMIGSWAQQNLTIPAVIRHTFDIVGSQASYTVGTGGDFNMARPPNQNSITGAALLYPTSPVVESPLGLLTDDGYRLWPLKAQTATLPSVAYYNPTITATFGTLYLLPIPDNALYDLALYVEQPLSRFADLTTTYAFPDGYEECLVYQLARRVAKPFGRPFDQDLKDKADAALAVIKRSNMKLSAMSNYFSGVGMYDINSDRIWVR